MESDSSEQTNGRPTISNRVKVYMQKLCQTRELNVFFASLCVIDLFGVFPIVALPGALISCGMEMWHSFMCRLYYICYLFSIV